MATPRKNWFKVPDSICFDALTNDELACLVRLQAYMNTRWARDGQDDSERGKCVIDARMAMTITGKGRPDVALTSLRHLADITSMSVRCHGNIASIDWPKYAEFQDSASREMPSPRLLQDSSKNREKKTPPAFALTPDPAAPSDPTPLLNLIANQDGEPDEKSAWLEAEWPLIRAEAEADGNPKRVKPIAIRFYRNYLKSDRRFRNWAAKQETRRRIAEHEAKFAGVIEEIEREEGYAAAHR